MLRHFLFISFLSLGQWVMGNTTLPELNPTLASTGSVICNLPAPSNLVVTDITTTSLSFAWSPVSGADGYGVQLIDVSNGEMVYTDHIYNENIAINGLQPDRQYEFGVWAYCVNGERGGVSTIIARTDFIIVDDIVANLQPLEDFITHGNYFNLYSDNFNGEPNIPFDIVNNADPEGNPRDFSAEKIFPNKENDSYAHHVKIKHINGDRDNPEKWLFRADTLFPFCPDLCSLSTHLVYVFRDEEGGGEYKLVVVIAIPRSAGQGGTQLVWEPIDPNYEVRQHSSTRAGENRSLKIEATDVEIATQPNPFNAQLIVSGRKSTDETARVSLIHAVTGQVMKQVEWSGTDDLIMPTADMVPGAYLLRYETSTDIKNMKLIKVK
jgi:Fibronectin type III domain